MDVEFPKGDVLVPGDLVETMERSYGMVVGRGWDEEGCFGYFVQTKPGFDRVWVYHGVAMSGETRVWRKNAEVQR